MPRMIEITSLTSPELDLYARLSEPQLLHAGEPGPGFFIAESPKVIERALDAKYEVTSFLVERHEAATSAVEVIARCPDAPVYVSDEETLKNLTGFALTRGVLAACRRRSLPAVEDICRDAKRIVILERVMNPTNVGAIFRSAAALGMDAVLLTPGCSDPLYRRAIRVSMGNVFLIPWTFIGEKETDWPEPGLGTLKKLGFHTIAMALTDRSIPMDSPELLRHEKIAVIMGTEGDGLSHETIAGCDDTVRIPMANGVDSLNVAAASAVAFWELGWKH